MKAKSFEQAFDEAINIIPALDLSKAKRLLQYQKRVNVDFPVWMIDSLDSKASKLGLTRQSVIKVWLIDLKRPGLTRHQHKSTSAASH